MPTLRLSLCRPRLFVSMYCMYSFDTSYLFILYSGFHSRWTLGLEGRPTAKASPPGQHPTGRCGEGNVGGSRVTRRLRRSPAEPETQPARPPANRAGQSKAARAIKRGIICEGTMAPCWSCTANVNGPVCTNCHDTLCASYYIYTVT